MKWAPAYFLLTASYKCGPTQSSVPSNETFHCMPSTTEHMIAVALHRVQGQHQPTASKCSFQLLSIRNSSVYRLQQRTHSSCPPTNLPTLSSAPERAKSLWNMPAGRTMCDVSFESIECHFTEKISPHRLSRRKGRRVGGRHGETKWLFLEDPLLLDEAKSFFPSVKTALVEPEDN